MVIDLQIAKSAKSLPTLEKFQKWSEKALETANLDIEMTIRIVDTEESQSLNYQYRGKDKATNVLSFPFENPPGLSLPILGDLVICAPVIEMEAKEQHKPALAHWAHMVVHGVLHLQGYDHISDEDADIMENKEITYLTELGFANPYD